MQLSRKVLLVVAAALLGASACVSAAQPRMSVVPIVSAARMAEIRGDGALNPAAAPQDAAEDAAEDTAEDTAEESTEESSEDVAEEGGSDAGESTSDGLVVAREEEGKRLPEADVIGEAPHTTLSSNEVDQVARYVLLGARKARCEGKAEHCDMVLKTCKDDDCAESSASESTEESSEDDSAAAGSEESSEESSGADEASSEDESSSEQEAAAESSEESSGAAAAASSDESEESSEESTSLEATLSAAEKKALADLQK